jgi:hypothetical protein
VCAARVCVWRGLHFTLGVAAPRILGAFHIFLTEVVLVSKMVSFEMNDLQKIGIGLTGFGVFFSFLGIIFFFDKGLLAMGNILFLSGLGLTIGLKSTLQFFTKPKNYKGTISFGAGLLLVLIGWPFFGMLLEAYGFIVLFSGFWPTLVVFLQKIPFIGWIFQQPFVASVQIFPTEKYSLYGH